MIVPLNNGKISKVMRPISILFLVDEYIGPLCRRGFYVSTRRQWPIQAAKPGRSEAIDIERLIDAQNALVRTPGYIHTYREWWNMPDHQSQSWFIWSETRAVNKRVLSSLIMLAVLSLG